MKTIIFCTKQEFESDSFKSDLKMIAIAQAFKGSYKESRDSLKITSMSHETLILPVRDSTDYYKGHKADLVLITPQLGEKLDREQYGNLYSITNAINLKSGVH